MVNRPTNENLSESLAEQIRRFWKERGHNIDITVVNVKGRSPTGGPLRIAEIVSDTLNGLPRGYSGSLSDLVPVTAPPDPPSRSKTRDCITCGAPFTSDGPGNRICPSCHDRINGPDRNIGRVRVR